MNLLAGQQGIPISCPPTRALSVTVTEGGESFS